MKYEDLPQRWTNRLKDHLTSKHGEVRNHLFVEDFENELTKIDFEDGSSVNFRYTLVLEAPDFKELAVFTEHCGYHIFSTGSIDRTILRQ